MLFFSLFNIRSVCTTFFSLNRLKFCFACRKSSGSRLVSVSITASSMKVSSSGPEIPGYVETEFEDVQPNGPMVEYRDSELAEDLTEE